MNDKGVAIQYGDVAPGAKESFDISASEDRFMTVSQLKQEALDFPNYGNPCDMYSVVLDGNAEPLPNAPQSSNVGLWSNQVSGDNGVFDEKITLYLESEAQFSSQGFTFTFDTDNNIYPESVNIRWTRVDGQAITLLGSGQYRPNNAFYFCKKKVENFNSVVIDFYKLNMPKNRLKIRSIDFGYGTYFFGDELRNVKLIQGIDPISSEISINTADFSLDSKRNMNYSFQQKQPLSIYFNGELKATTFVSSSKRKSKFLWDVQSEDYIGLFDGIPYGGGMYKDTLASEILEDIFKVAKAPYHISDELKETTVTGYIPYTTCREALMQVAFAIQAVVDTSNSSVVNVLKLQDKLSQGLIKRERIMQGQSFTDEETVTGVEVALHAYKPIEETLEVYNADESGTGDGIFIKFSEPLHDLTIINGEIVSSATNHATINASEGCIFTGKKYEHTTQTKRKNNPVVLASEVEKVVAVDNATLVSSQNIDNVLERCYDWLVRASTTNLKIVERKQEIFKGFTSYGSAKYGKNKYGAELDPEIILDTPTNVGDMIEAETEYLGTVKGRIIKQTFSLNGNTLVKDSVLK